MLTFKDDFAAIANSTVKLSEQSNRFFR